MRYSTKTGLFQTLQKVFWVANQTANHPNSLFDIFQKIDNQRMTRRQFVDKMSKITLLSSLMRPMTPFYRPLLDKRLQSTPRIAIIGGGMAGLSALHAFRKMGLEATIYEASGRLGGRILTVPAAMGAGTYTEFGGEFIDTSHTDMHQLAAELRISLMDMTTDNPALIQETCFAKGKHQLMPDLITAFRPIARRLKRDMAKLPDTIHYKTQDPVALKFDRMSIAEYLESIDASKWVKTILEAAYEAEFGASCQVQSALNLLTLIQSDLQNQTIAWFGDSDERYKAIGGNQLFIESLSNLYADSICLEHRLERLTATSTHYQLQFRDIAKPIRADFVILTLPFTMLRKVELQVSMPQVKWDAINELGYGTNAKLMIGFQKHYWRELGYQGLVYADNGVMNGWDNAQLQTQDAENAGFTIFLGGNDAIQLGKGAPAAQKTIYLSKLEKIYKGISAFQNGKVARMQWHHYPTIRGSYICYKVGQYTRFGGAEGMPIGNLLFAGEHCGGVDAGFMNGAAKTGRQAAEKIIAKILC